jgi:hypothetical protein
VKDDNFREMASRCGDLSDSVMAVPGLEYVGERSAEWEALCVRAASYLLTSDVLPRPPFSMEEHSAFKAWDSVHYPNCEEICSLFSGLALFASLMAIVTRGE